MSDDSRCSDPPARQLPAKDDCPLPGRLQTRNLLLFAVNKSLIYLAGPVLYVGMVDAALLNKLEFSDKLANLPLTAYFWTTAPLMVLCTWYFCRVRMLKPMLVSAYFIIAAASGLTFAAVVQPMPGVTLTALVLRATLVGWCLGIVSFYEWEILARGVSEHRRGFALSLAYGLGPILAVLSSLAMQLVLDGRVGSAAINKIAFPWNFAVLFGAALPIMGLASFLSLWYTIPLPRTEVGRPPLVSGVLGGIGEFLSYRTFVLITVVFLAICAGSDSILPTVTLYTKNALGEAPENYVGYQYALRFGFKIAAGFVLGWLLVRANAKVALLAAIVFSVGGLTWALGVTGKWYLVAFGILGGGELYGVYYQNYLVSCSAKSKVRRNLAYCGLLAMPMVVMPVVYGALSDAFGPRASLQVALGLLAVALVTVVVFLPSRPRPRPCDLDSSDFES